MAETADQKDKVPTMKVQAATAASAATTVLVWFVGEFGVEVPVLVAGAVTTLLVFAAGYFKREKKETADAG
jgi:hypothetical protein